jgi:choline dehydrogenase-like flavoprotein
MKQDDVPPPALLTAHVRTATDGAIRWLDRALSADPGDLDAWDHASFYARMILMRGLERGELLAWSLGREGASTADPERRMATRAGTAYWGEAREGLDGGLRTLRRLAGEPPTFARADVQAVREQLVDANQWLDSLAERLAATAPQVIELEPPERTRTVASDLELEAM